MYFNYSVDFILTNKTGRLQKKPLALKVLIEILPPLGFGYRHNSPTYKYAEIPLSSVYYFVTRLYTFEN